ncbi:MAG: cytochrome c [Planctomycetota bacterium]
MSQQPQFKTAVERGRQALLSKSYAPALVSQGAYDRLWQQWSHAAPKDFKAAVLERYGLHEAPYQNDGFPMGLRKALSATGDEIGVGYDCLLCHAGSINGQSLIGLGNSSLEWQSLFDELFESEGVPHGIPIPFSHVRGTTEAAAAIVHLMQIRDENLNFRLPVKIAFEGPICEDVPAWWLMKKKRHLYHPGSHPGESVRIGMAFLLHPLNRGEEIKNAEADYRDIREFILSLKAPPYPFPINKNLAATGEGLFNINCAACHGTYGENEQFPSKVVELSVIGTDPVLVEQFAVYAQEAYNKSWFGKEQSSDGRHLQARATDGYQAPPLDGVWATAPYFHNGSVPTVGGVLDSQSRPRIFTRSFRTDGESYDPVNLGWKYQTLDVAPLLSLPQIQQRRVYDTTQRGRSNAGHPFGDQLSKEDRQAIIEYLKTL